MPVGLRGSIQGVYNRTLAVLDVAVAVRGRVVVGAGRHAQASTVEVRTLWERERLYLGGDGLSGRW